MDNIRVVDPGAMPKLREMHLFAQISKNVASRRLQRPVCAPNSCMSSAEGVAGEHGGCPLGCNSKCDARNLVPAFLSNETERMLQLNDFSGPFTHCNLMKT